MYFSFFLVIFSQKTGKNFSEIFEISVKAKGQIQSKQVSILPHSTGVCMWTLYLSFYQYLSLNRIMQEGKERDRD